MMAASNVYNLLAGLHQLEVTNTTSSSEPDWTDEDTQKRVHSTPFNLNYSEAKFGGDAIFTRQLLQEIKSNKIAITTELQKPAQIRRQLDPTYMTVFGKFKVWNLDEEDDFNEDIHLVTIRLMSRVELHPDFQSSFWKVSKTNRMLRVTNQMQEKHDWVPVPYALTLGCAVQNHEHRDMDIMRGYWKAIQNTKSLWLKSSSRRKLLRLAEQLASSYKPITKIVCFGLGALNHDKAWYESSLQHITAFTIAKHLEQAYRQNSLYNNPVEVIFQDPCYSQKDRELLKRLYKGGTLSFASDPDGLLAIDSNTVVLTAFLPIGYPLMQVISDMFHGTNGEGPTAIVCDSMDLNPQRELYTLGDRSSPAVAQFLKEQYVTSDFKNHVLEKELAEDLFGAANTNRQYWLSEMQLHLRKPDGIRSQL